MVRATPTCLRITSHDRLSKGQLQTEIRQVGQLHDIHGWSMVTFVAFMPYLCRVGHRRHRCEANHEVEGSSVNSHS